MTTVPQPDSNATPRVGDTRSGALWPPSGASTVRSVSACCPGAAPSTSRSPATSASSSPRATVAPGSGGCLRPGERSRRDGRAPTCSPAHRCCCWRSGWPSSATATTTPSLPTTSFHSTAIGAGALPEPATTAPRSSWCPAHRHHHRRSPPRSRSAVHPHQLLLAFPWTRRDRRQRRRPRRSADPRRLAALGCR
jgi:hypothetical protein